MDFEKAYQTLTKTVMPQSFPLGVKIIKQDDHLPDGAVRPAKFGLKIAMCQWPTLARRWGWIIGVMAEDVNCVPCLAGFGFKKLKNQADLAQFLMDMGYAESMEPAETLADSIEPLEPGQVKGIAAFPLDKAPTVPDLVWIYGTPAQMIRLVIAYALSFGRPIRSETGFGLSCLAGVKPFFSDEPAFVIPGRGERMLAGTDDSEMYLSLPASHLEGLIDGLEKSHKKGLRFPIQGYVMYQPAVIPPMKALLEKLTDV